jgi:hypothetical protein
MATVCLACVEFAKSNSLRSLRLISGDNGLSGRWRSLCQAWSLDVPDKAFSPGMAGPAK